jgi:DNA polymerase-1
MLPAMSRIFLLDGSALAYRSHFALARSGLTSPNGEPTGATYGFTMTLRRILETESPDLIAACFDPPGKTFRHERYAEYKGTRQKMPEELVHQQKHLRDVVRAHDVPLFEVPGYEADDVIGTLARQAEAAGWDVSIVTGDKDFMQLVGDKIRLYNVFKKDQDVVIEGLQAVQDKFGTTPDHVCDVLAIMGDASDNIPGVKGIGEKGATKLIAEFGSVSGLLERLDEVKGKTKEKIEQDRDALLLSLDLVRIRTDVQLDPGFEGIRPAEPDDAALSALFHELGFQSLVKSVAQKTSETEERDYHLIRTAEELEAMVQELTQAGAFAWDTETTSLFAMEAELVGLSFSAAERRAFYVPFNLDPPILPGGPTALLEALTPLLTDPALKRCGQNTKYDSVVLAAHGVRVPPPAFDTMVASFCVAGSTRRHGLDELALTYFDLKKIPTKELLGTGKKQTTMDKVDIERVGEYAAEDADVTWRLKQVLERELKDGGVEELYYDLELQLVPVLAAMEERGILLDVELLGRLAEETEAELTTHMHKVQELAGRNFNVNSTKALGEVLFEELRIQDQAGVKRVKKTKTGWATDHATLSEKYGEVEIVRELLEYREVQKLKSTYLDPLPGYAHPRTGRVHCSFSQVSAATGRLASSEPNLQNIPIRTERGRKLRAAFIPPPPDKHGEWVLLSADYSQVELRVLAHLSDDRELIRAFAEGRDIHTSTAAVVFDVMEGLVTREMRSRAKAVNYGLLYGMGASRLARETKLSVPEARQFIERYFKSFPNVRGFIDGVLEGTREKGYAETLLGRKRRIPEIRSEDARTRAGAENAAVNTPVQGSAADIIKRAMINLERRLTESPLAGRMLLQVHDELLLELPASELEETSALVRDCMENAVPLKVPLQVDLGSGPSWLEAH